MTDWHLDEGLVTLRAEWQKAYPGAVVYTIGDLRHQAEPSEHNPEHQGSLPGQDEGEVDAADFMPSGGGVTMEILGEFRDALVATRDKRLLYVIYRDQIVSSVVSPWTVRKYNGTYHNHLHVSVNDLYDKNTSDWQWEKMMARTYTMLPVSSKWPELRVGDEDKDGGVQYIQRFQGILNAVFHQELVTDGVYGAKTAASLAYAMRADIHRTTSNGTRFGVAEVKRILGLW